MNLRHRRRKTQKRKHHLRKTRRRRLLHVSKPPNALLNFSPVSSPGPNSPSPLSPNTPGTKQAKQLATMYPNRRTMIQRSSSFNNGLSIENFYREFERLFPEKNGPAYQ
jgi:hypothetical protein